jgi:hypothetical protein
MFFPVNPYKRFSPHMQMKIDHQQLLPVNQMTDSWIWSRGLRLFFDLEKWMNIDMSLLGLADGD